MSKEEKVVEIQLFTSIDEYIVEQVCAILTENNIPFVKKIDGSGSYINISMGQSLEEKRIFVNKDDYDKALKLIELFTEQEDDEIDTDMQKEINKYATKKKLMVYFVFGLPLLVMILVIVSEIINK